MNASHLKSPIASPHRRPLIAFVLLSLLFTPLAAMSEESKSIDLLRQLGKAFASIAEKASPAVVGIRANQAVNQQYSQSPDWPFGGPFDDEFFDQFFGRRFRQQRPQQQQPQQPQQRKVIRPVQGSGFLVSKDGYIITNNHVIEDAEEISVTLLDGREFNAKLVGTDPASEVAVIKIDANNLPNPLELANSDTLEVGEWVIAIGNPFGLSHTVTAGIVSAKGRSNVISELEYQDFIQTDAAINPGNSGGPLINLDDKVVGINTAIIGANINIGIGLAIPANMAKFVYDRLVKGEPVTRAILGVVVTDVNPDLAESLELKQAEGVVVNEVQPDSAADKAGLKRYDVITQFNGEKVKRANEFRNRIAMLRPGSQIELVILRDGKTKNVTATLGERPAEATSQKTTPGTLEKLGLDVQNLTADLAEQLDLKDSKGVVITKVDPDSQAAMKGLNPGMLIMEVNRKPVENVKEFNKAIENAAKTGKVLLLVNDGKNRWLVVLNLQSH